MDRKRITIEKLIPLLDDNTFGIFAGLVNAQQFSGQWVNAADEVAILRDVLDSEFRSTFDPQIGQLIKLLD